MYQHKTSFKSLEEYDLDRLIEQRKNLAQVQSVLSLYDKNNQDLVDQVHSLIQQNQALKTQIRNSSPKRLKQSSFTHKSSISEANSYLETQKSTLRKQRSSKYINKFNHPRNVYMAPLQVQMLNRKMLEQAKNAQKKYDISRGYENFKQKLNERKQQLKKSYTRSSFKTSQVSMSKNPYIEDPSQEIKNRQPLTEISKPNINISSPKFPQQVKKVVEKLPIPSPYSNFEKSNLYYSPEKCQLSVQAKRQDTQRSSSAIKVENSYPQISIKIPEPKTKWGDLSSTYFSKSKLIKNVENEYPEEKQQQFTLQVEKDRKSKKKRFLHVISQSIDVKLIQKSQR